MNYVHVFLTRSRFWRQLKYLRRETLTTGITNLGSIVSLEEELGLAEMGMGS